MQKMIIGTLVTLVLLGSALLFERSLRLNRSTPKSKEELAKKVLPTAAPLRNVLTKEMTTLGKFSNKVVLINFWASWCEACMAEMPSIAKLYSTLKSEGFEVLSVNLDEDPEKIVPRVINQLGLNFPVYTDADGVLVKTFDVVAIPFSAVLAKELKIHWVESGERDWASDEIIEEVRGLLKKTQ